MIVDVKNWNEVYRTDFTNQNTVMMAINGELFQTDDRGIALIEKMQETHTAVHTIGNGIDGGCVKIWKKK